MEVDKTSDQILSMIPLRLLEMLRERGVSDEEILSALAEDSLHLLAVDQMLGPPRSRMDILELSKETGIDKQVIRRLWRALGFTDVSDGEKVFTPLDVEAILSLRGLVRSGTADVDIAIQLARVIGSSMARIAEAEIVASNGLKAIEGDSEDLSTVDLADRFARYSAATLPALPQLLIYAWIRHLHAAGRRAMVALDKGAPNVSELVLAVGFVDLVGFTILSQQLTTQELGAVVSRFEELSSDAVTKYGGRVVKMIGDEVMYVAEDAYAAVQVGVILKEEYSKEKLLSEVRAGVAYGPVLAREGDYYGPTVNLASRIVNIANPGSILVSDGVHQHLPPDENLHLVPLRPRYLKDLGSVQLWVVNPSD
ncbi:MAG: adenylate/guanylate cyclase domain-containing protein [Actinobacteria bacterium]|nr:adenylate/guanylate cyclase domain-containing protein [Actinomycetota bacterium]